MKGLISYEDNKNYMKIMKTPYKYYTHQTSC